VRGAIKLTEYEDLAMFDLSPEQASSSENERGNGSFAAVGELV
jgi:hypothetical protein